MSPAGGSMEQQLDAKTLDSATAWELFLAFLERVGVDKMSAFSADLHVSAGVNGGHVMVTEFKRNADGSHAMKDGDLMTISKTFPFSRGS